MKSKKMCHLMKSKKMCHLMKSKKMCHVMKSKMMCHLVKSKMCHLVSSYEIQDLSCYEIQEDVSSCVIICHVMKSKKLCHHVSSYEIQEDVSCYEIQEAVDFIRGFHKCTHTLHYFLSQMCHLMKSCIHPRSWIYAAARTHIDIMRFMQVQTWGACSPRQCGYGID